VPLEPAVPARDDWPALRVLDHPVTEGGRECLENVAREQGRFRLRTL
jgi:hypothetical protein